MDVGQIQLLLLGGLCVTMKIERATIVHASAVAFRSEALPGAQDREELAHFEFSLFEQFHGGGAALDDGIELGNKVHSRGQGSLVRPHVLKFQEERARVG